MNRRDMIARAAAVAAAAAAIMAISRSASAAQAVRDTAETMVSRAFAILDNYDFTLAEKTSILGFSPSGIKTLSELKSATHAFAVDYGSRDLKNRIAWLTSLHESLGRHFYYETAERIRWLNETPIRPGSGFTCRTLLTRGGYMDLCEVARFASSINA